MKVEFGDAFGAGLRIGFYTETLSDEVLLNYLIKDNYLQRSATTEGEEAYYTINRSNNDEKASTGLKTRSWTNAQRAKHAATWAKKRAAKRRKL